MSEREIKLPYGLRENALVHISEVGRGIECGCVCPSCHEPLVAKKGTKVVEHFAHKGSTECPSALETAIHLAAKDILLKHKKIVLPAVEIKFNVDRNPITICEKKSYDLEDVILEHKTGDIVPDIVAYIQGVPLLIEVCVTHEVDETKTRKIQKLGISTIEVDLSMVPRSLPPADLVDAVIGNSENKQWIFNAKVEKYYKQLLATGKRMAITERRLALHVDYCPINIRNWKGKPYANVMDDCIYCEFALDVELDYEKSRYTICGGATKIKTFQQLKSLGTAK